MSVTLDPFAVSVESVGDCTEPIVLSGHHPWLLSFKSDLPFKGTIQIDNAVDGFEDLFINHSLRADIDSDNGPRYLIVASGIYRFKLREGTARVEMRARERGMVHNLRA